eukprot:CAMPEP_0176154870 /NCGR_PEP_ID=MMETSP0120_2-20121206/79122_1 /TAXON_ID=160619 /ORGANISM="Kryptoperidinium foliaceum, Strain CCMP 1326" /LENGTH=63 /DNA_ID=CAMNT_0017491977 /DNA_START=9 /DNA_END=196 /DNA_ORIENTATION=+
MPGKFAPQKLTMEGPSPVEPSLLLSPRAMWMWMAMMRKKSSYPVGPPSFNLACALMRPSVHKR